MKDITDSGEEPSDKSRAKVENSSAPEISHALLHQSARKAVLPFILGLCAALPFFLSSTGAKNVFSLELRLQSNVENSPPHVYYDYGAGFNGWDNTEPSPPRATDAPDVCRFALPTGELLRLRLDPFDTEGIALLSNARICDARGQTVWSFKAGDFEPLNEIANITPQSETVVQLVTNKGARDPYLALHLAKPLKLSASFDALGRLPHALPVFAMVFAAVFVVGQLQHRKQADTTVAPCSVFPRWATIVSVAIILFARLPDRFLNPQFYAEDVLWYSSYIADGLKTFVTPYGGYLLTIDRLVACLSTLVPLLFAPLCMNMAALLFTLAVVWRVLSPRNPLPHKPWLALAIILIPRPDDIFLTITNIQWVLSLALVVLLLSDDAKSIPQRLYDYATAAISGLTGVYSIITLPLFGYRFIQRRTTHSAMLLAVVGLAAGVQAWFVVHTPPLTPADSISPNSLHILATLGFQLFAHLFGGTWLLPLSIQILAGLGIAASTLVIVLVWPIRLLKQNGPKLYLMAAICLFSAASIYRFKGMLPMFFSPEGLSRYFFVPQVLLIWLLIINLTAANRFRQVLCAILVIALSTTTYALFKAPSLANFHWREQVNSLRPGQAVNIPVNPRGWYFRGYLTPDGRMGPMEEATAHVAP